MKLLKLITLLLVLTLFNSNTYAAQDCDEVKGNIVGKLFCKARSNISSGSNVSSGSSSSETSNSTKEESTGWKIWKKPEWMKKKN